MDKGQVIKTTGSWYTVQPENRNDNPVQCKIKGNFRIKGIKATNPVAVGDYVGFIVNEDQTGLITQVEDRKNYIIRRSSNLSKQYQLIASNVDQAWLVISLVSPKTLPEFIDRFLVSAEAYRIPVSIIMNKTDLLNEDLRLDLEILNHLYSSIGYPCYPVSAKLNEGILPVKEKMKNKINVFSGNSGVGKSTLINVLDENLNLKTGIISEAHHTGKHTTTFAEMHELNFGGYIIDTPGIKGFGLIDFDKEELFHFFPEIFKFSHDCKYHNCLHQYEPGCAVIKAVEENQIFETRYISYLKMLEDKNSDYR